MKRAVMFVCFIGLSHTCLGALNLTCKEGKEVLFCRGRIPDISFRNEPPRVESRPQDESLILYFYFLKNSYGAGNGGEFLQPGTCAYLDRPLREDEKAEVVAFGGVLYSAWSLAVLDMIYQCASDTNCVFYSCVKGPGTLGFDTAHFARSYPEFRTVNPVPLRKRPTSPTDVAGELSEQSPQQIPQQPPQQAPQQTPIDPGGAFNDKIRKNPKLQIPVPPVPQNPR